MFWEHQIEYPKIKQQFEGIEIGDLVRVTKNIGSSFHRSI